MDTLKELYVDQLQDLWSANNQAVKVFRELTDAATDSKLKSKLEKSITGTQEHNRSLEQLIRGYDAQPNAEHCRGMEGLVKEARAHALDADYGEDAVRDASIIAQFQRITHYGIAGYGTCRAMANQLKANKDEQELSRILKETYQGDDTMTELSRDTNRKAA